MKTLISIELSEGLANGTPEQLDREFAVSAKRRLLQGKRSATANAERLL